MTPYLWGTSLSGVVGVTSALPPVNIDASFSDLLSDLDAAAFLLVEANDGRIGFSSDLQYVKLSVSDPTPGGGFGSANVIARNTILSALGEYNLHTSPRSEIWALGGARYWKVDNELTLTPGRLAGRSARTANSWVDPMIGLRGRTAIGGNSFLTGWAMIGGFGVGSESAADVFGGYGYQFSNTTSGILGYRWMTVDRVDGGFIYDTTQQGLMAGVAFNF